MAYNSNQFLDLDKRPSIIRVTDLTYPYLQSYYDLGLSDELLKSILNELYMDESPHPMHAITLPMVTSELHRSLMVQSRRATWNWNFFCYTICMIHRITMNTSDNPQAIVICPTEELAKGIYVLVERFRKFVDVSATIVINPDAEMDLQTHILITTPVALMSLVFRNKLLLSHIKVVVIDKADHLLELSVGPAIVDFMTGMHPECQVLLFYATLTDNLRQFVSNILPDWKWDRVFVNKEELAIYNSKMFKMVFRHENHKSQFCFEIIDRLSIDKQVIIFVNPETDLQNLYDSLSNIDVKAAPEVRSHHYFDQDRAQSVQSFKSGKTRVLITSKPHSVGFDKSMVSMVIFHDFPMINATEPDFERYYRIATRVGRNTDKVSIFNLLNRSDETIMKKIETHFGRTAKKMSPDDKFDTTVEIEAALEEVGMMEPYEVYPMEEEEENEEDAVGWGMEDEDALMDDENNDGLAFTQDDIDNLNNLW